MLHAVQVGYDSFAMGIEEQRARASERAATAKTAFATTLSAMTGKDAKKIRDLVAVLDVDQSTISRWRTGSQEPRIGVAAAVADALGVSLDYMLSGDRRALDEERVPDRRLDPEALVDRRSQRRGDRRTAAGE